MRSTLQTKGVAPDDQSHWALVISLLREGKRVRFNPAGTSMSPFIRDRQSVVAAPCEPLNLKVGDIILCEERDRQVLRIHRIVKKQWANGNVLLTTQGDALTQTDAPVEISHVLGRICAVEKGGRLLDLDRPVGRTVNCLWSLFQRLPVSYPLLRFAGRAVRLARARMPKNFGSRYNKAWCMEHRERGEAR